MIALHASLLARRTGRPVRMIYDRHEDLSATTKRHPAIVRHRTGLTRDGRIVAQDIDLVLDGGAYTTLTPVVLSRATIHAGGPYDVANIRIRSRAVATNTPPNGAFRGFGAPQAEFAAEMQVNRAAEALGMSPLELRRRNVYRPGGITATGQVLGRDVAGMEVLDRAAEASEFERARARTAAERAARPANARTARGIGLALAWHGAGFTGSGEEKMGSVASLELTGRGPDPDPDRLDRDGAGDEDDLPAAGRRGARGRHRRGRDGPPGHRDRARLGSHRRLADGDGRGRAGRARRAAAQGGGGGSHGPSVRAGVPGRRPGSRTHPHRRAVRALSRPAFRRRHLHGRRVSLVRLGRRRGRGGGGPRHGRGGRAVGRRRRRRRARDPPGPVRGPGRGRDAPGRGLRDDRGDQAGRRPVPQRPAADLPDPDLARRAAHRHHPRGGAVRGRAARRQGRGRAADGRGGAGSRCSDPRCHRGLDPRPSRDAGADPGRPGRLRAARSARRVGGLRDGTGAPRSCPGRRGSARLASARRRRGAAA